MIFPEYIEAFGIEVKCKYVVFQMSKLDLSYKFSPHVLDSENIIYNKALLESEKLEEKATLAKAIVDYTEVFDKEILSFLLELYNAMLEAHLFMISLLAIEGFTEESHKIVGGRIL